jgi:hypothetical protein
VCGSKGISWTRPTGRSYGVTGRTQLLSAPSPVYMYVCVCVYIYVNTYIHRYRMELIGPLVWDACTV